jgi:putative PIN family toxin of toxin-antitoxin system
MALKKIRVILDTNWYVSAAINKRSRRIIYELLNNDSLTIIFCDEILAEFKQVIARDKFKKIIKTEQVTRFINLVTSKTENVEIKSNLTGSRDPNDNYLLSLAFNCEADYLITGDLDLLVLKEIEKTNIITLRDFLDVISHKTQ